MVDLHPHDSPPPCLGSYQTPGPKGTTDSPNCHHSQVLDHRPEGWGPSQGAENTPRRHMPGSAGARLFLCSFTKGLQHFWVQDVLKSLADIGSGHPHVPPTPTLWEHRLRVWT